MRITICGSVLDGGICSRICCLIPAARNVVATGVYGGALDVRDQGPEEMRPVGATEFANGIAAMCSSGIYGKTRACAGIVGHAI
jgi:hypothetical protein